MRSFANAQDFACRLPLGSASLTPANRLNFNDVKKGDVIEAFVTERIAAEMGVV